jgi:hypothetical protein
MKKQAHKKLALSAQTVRNLEPDKLELVEGGLTTFVSCTCPPTTRCTNRTECL